MSSLRKDDPAQTVAGDQPADTNKIEQHPLFSGSAPVALISADNPRFPVEAPGGHEALGNHLRALGLKAEPTQGRYETPENSYVVYGPTREQVFDLGKKFGQESVVYSQNGNPEMLFCNGPKAGRFSPPVRKPDGSLDFDIFSEPPEDYFTQFQPFGFLRLKFDWDALHPAPLQEPHASQALQLRAKAEPVQKSEYSIPEFLGELARTLKKSLDLARPHPHCYPWFNSRTSDCLHHGHGGVFVGKGLSKAEAPSYHQTAVPFGSINPGQPADLHHYPLEGKSGAVDQLVRDFGYQVAHVGGQYGRPDLDHKNYDTKWLPIFHSAHPHAGAEDSVDSWRKLHELAHALTEPDVDSIYGPGKRVGALGQHRNLQEALRSVHWEWLACHRQRELSRQIGADLNDETFNKELNTVVHDAVHRAITGHMVDPGAEGFAPYSHQIPLERSLSMVREASNNLPSTNLGKQEPAVANEKEISVQELKQLLAKSIRERISEYEKSLLELRKRELAKAEALTKSAKVEKQPVTLCKGCNRASTLCKCNKKSELVPKSKVIPAPGSGGQIKPGMKKDEFNFNPSMSPKDARLASLSAPPRMSRASVAPPGPATTAKPKARVSVAPPGPATTAGRLPAPPPPPVAKAEQRHSTSTCRHCGSENTEYAGQGKDLGDKKSRNFKCKDCGKTSAHKVFVSDSEDEVAKADVPMAKPPTANPMTTPASKPAAPKLAAPTPAAPKPPAMKAEAPMAKAGMPAVMGGDDFAAGSQSPKTKLPSPEQNMARANDLASQLPPAGTDHLKAPKIGAAPPIPAAAAAPGVPPQALGSARIAAVGQHPIESSVPTPATARLTGLAKIRAAAQQPLKLSEAPAHSPGLARRPEPKKEKSKEGCSECGKGKPSLDSGLCLDCLGKAESSK